ncbi:hypothetical protein QE400_002196 [Xanthomonas sacchari]|uniref:hypothetical protein n=1 Tax=Xanthomonas sacchari TaxID=56458 RepID=UPI002788693C|nr:hypothetical protein [Xanthomonas sacchari]MDQ1092783.1 hypothetical protein [Xanthomonas sacchari]
MINVNGLTLRGSQFRCGFAFRQGGGGAPERRNPGHFVYGAGFDRPRDVTDRHVWRHRHEVAIRTWAGRAPAA